MTSPTRRTFVAATGAGAATAALSLAAPAYADDSDANRSGGSPGNGPLVAYVADLSAGRVVVVRGDRRTEVTDRRLAARLAAAAGGQR